jgi:hypothetical protein
METPDGGVAVIVTDIPEDCFDPTKVCAFMERDVIPGFLQLAQAATSKTHSPECTCRWCSGDADLTDLKVFSTTGLMDPGAAESAVSDPERTVVKD